MQARIQVATLLALALTLCGCWEVKEKITLNPDGSGKLAFDLVTAAAPDINPFGGKTEMTVEDPQQAARNTVAKLIHEEAKGVQAWKDLSFEILKDGRIRVQAVAYFGDFAKLRLPWSLQGMKWQKVEGGMVLDGALRPMKKPAMPMGPPGAPAPQPEPVKELTPKQLQTKLLAARMSYQQSRGLVAATMGPLKTDTTFMLPGKLVEHGAFQKTPAGGLRVALAGKKVLEVTDKLMADDEVLTDAIKAGKEPTEGKLAEKRLNQLLFKSEAPLRAKVAGDLKPLFDYETEMTAAKAAMAALFGKLKIPLTPQKPAFPAPAPTLPDEDF